MKFFSNEDFYRIFCDIVGSENICMTHYCMCYKECFSFCLQVMFGGISWSGHFFLLFH